MSIHEIFSQKVRQYREENHLTQANMAEMCNISIEYYQRIEHGRANVGLDNAVFIATVLYISIDALKEEVRRQQAREDRQ